jgi:phosphatidylinositol-3-phosphatase
MIKPAADPVACSARLAITLVLVLVATVAACTGGDAPSTPSTGGSSSPVEKGPCGGEPSTLRPIEHVVVIMEENLSIGSLLGDPGSRHDRRAPFLNRIARTCGLATEYRALTQPSHPNYIGAVSGDTHIPRSCHVIRCILRELDEQSIFGQLQEAGLSWRVYVESMSTPCRQDSDDLYELGHNPAAWFLPIRDECLRSNVDFDALDHDLRGGRLPSFTWIVPNEDHNMHTSSGGPDRRITMADTWLRQLMTRLVDSPEYADGSVVVIVTWDEGDLSGVPFNRDCLRPALAGDESCHVATIIVSQWVRPGTTSDAPFSHYSVLKTSERLLGLPLLLHARDPKVPDLISDFGLRGGG